MATLLIGVPFILVGLFFLVLAIGAWMEARGDLRWATTTGVITRSRVIITRLHRDSPYGPELDLAYDYRVQNRDLTGTRPTLDVLVTPATTQALAARYPVGRRVRVHYDPDAPEVSTLEVSTPGKQILVLLLIGVSALAIGGAGLWDYVR